MRTAIQIFAVAAIVAIAACAATPEAKHGGAIMLFNPYDRADARPGTLLNGGLDGTFLVKNECLTIETTSGVVMTPLFPEGSTMTPVGRNFLLRLPDERGSTSTNRLVKIAGAPFRGNVADISLPPSFTCPSNFYLISTVSAG